MSAIRTQQRYTVDEYEEMVVRGILTEHDRVELIRGEIVDKMTIGTPHFVCVNRLNRIMVRLFGDNGIVSIQNPVLLADSAPEPDVVVLHFRADEYSSGKPAPADVLLLIEVSDSTIDFDRDVKGPLYAESGIVEYWIANVDEERLEVHRRPNSTGTYEDVRILHRGDTVDLTAMPGVSIAVTDILGA